ncbi:MAG: hypothetical protein LJE65_00845 [Desulfobacteraceae bacterium]|nr:hypothetical protein [Desulfobacteraceae bacterium]
MPDLSHLDNKLTTSLLLNALSFKAGSANPKARALWTNFVRLMDQMVMEYNRGREALKAYADSADQDLGSLFRATAHMETCLISLRRAVRFVRRIRLKRDCPHCGDLTVTSDGVVQRLRRFCEALDRTEERVLARDAAESAEMLLLSGDGLHASGNEIRYEEIAGWIEEMNTLAVALTAYDDLEDPHTL